MKKLILAAVLMLPIAACTSTEQGAVGGGLVGAAVGCAVASNCAEGAIIGGAGGALAGAVIGNAADRPGYCEYRDRRGNVYVDRCPDGYGERRSYRRGRY